MISVIIINHDGEAHLGRCLESLDGSGAEVLLVDNASRDDSLSLVRERFPEVEVLPQDENLGFAAANNLAAAKASGEALLLLNADAWLEAGALDLLAAKLSGRPDVGLVAPRLRYPDSSPGRLRVGSLARFCKRRATRSSRRPGRMVHLPVGWRGWLDPPGIRPPACWSGPRHFERLGDSTRDSSCTLRMWIFVFVSRPPGGAWPRSSGLSFVTPVVLRAGARSTTSIGRRSFATIGSTGRSGKAASWSVACADDATRLPLARAPFSTPAPTR